MSAAATAAGYLYASGRLRGRAAREQEHHEPQKAHHEPHKADRPKEARDRIRVAVVDAREEAVPAPQRTPKTPKIEYRVRRRWAPE
jgi:hypothetical protein